MKIRRDQRKAEKAAIKREKGEDDSKSAKRVKKSIIVPQRLESSTINSKLNTITSASIKGLILKKNFTCVFRYKKS